LPARRRTSGLLTPCLGHGRAPPALPAWAYGPASPLLFDFAVHTVRRDLAVHLACTWPRRTSRGGTLTAPGGVGLSVRQSRRRLPGQCRQRNQPGVQACARWRPGGGRGHQHALTQGPDPRPARSSRPSARARCALTRAPPPRRRRDAFEFAYAMRSLPAEEAGARALPQPRFRSWFGRLPAQPEQAKRGLREEDLGALQARPPRPSLGLAHGVRAVGEPVTPPAREQGGRGGRGNVGALGGPVAGGRQVRRRAHQVLCLPRRRAPSGRQSCTLYQRTLCPNPTSS